ncbi:MAG TPA: hypothetical protein VL551_09880 [Actinospica sp.]|jgi:hypothetical protein|nr:hypothetical protein [Actinospica sp.]
MSENKDEALSAESYKNARVICGVYDKDEAAFAGDDVQAHSAEMLPSTQVICGVYDKDEA